MELIPSRTAVIAVHMQHDIVAAEGAFGGFFAGQAAERDVVGQAGELLVAARLSRPDRQLAAAGHGRAITMPDRGQRRS